VTTHFDAWVLRHKVLSLSRDLSNFTRRSSSAGFSAFLYPYLSPIMSTAPDPKIQCVHNDSFIFVIFPQLTSSPTETCSTSRRASSRMSTPSPSRTTQILRSLEWIITVLHVVFLPEVRGFKTKPKPASPTDNPQHSSCMPPKTYRKHKLTVHRLS